MKSDINLKFGKQAKRLNKQNPNHTRFGMAKEREIQTKEEDLTKQSKLGFGWWWAMVLGHGN